jgi:dynein-related subfamily AAA family protein
MNGEAAPGVQMPSTYLLAWNPTKSTFPELEEAIIEIRDTGGFDTDWSSGVTRNMPAGSRFYLLRLGLEPKGLVGSGVVLVEPQAAGHWDAEKNAGGAKSLRVRVRFDRLARNPFVRRSELNEAPFVAMHWDIQASGARIDDGVAKHLAALWKERVSALMPGMIAISPPVVRRWRARWEEAQRDEAWLERNRLRDGKRREVVPAIQALLRSFLDGSVPLEEFRDTFHRRTSNEWDLFGLKGSGAMFLNTVVKDLPDTEELRAQLVACLAIPANEGAAREKLESFTAYLHGEVASGESTTRRLAPKRVGFLASACWHMFDVEAWPPFYPSARKALQADGLLGEPATVADAYLEFREVFSGLSHALGLSSWDFEHLCNREGEPALAAAEPDQDVSAEDDDWATRERVWLVAPGPRASEWESFQAKGIIAIGWSYLGDLSQYSDPEALILAIQAHEGTGKNPTHDALACRQFVHTMQVGDKIFAKKGRNEIVGYGVVTSEYRHEPERGEYSQVRSVDWKRAGSWVPPKSLVTKTLTEIGQDPQLVNDLHRALGITGSIHPPRPDEPPSPIYRMTDALKEVFLTELILTEAVELLRYKKNLVLQGPPGAGKTFIAKRLAYLLLGARDPERIHQVQFHQSYSYEDFIQGYRPGENGQFTRVDGPFLRFCEQALQDPSVPYVLIIDEINRGNLSKIFGELLLLLEADKRSAAWATALTYSTAGERFHVPSNLHVIGTMNTADRSLALVDYALRRRFAFMSIEPALEHTRFSERLTELGATPALCSKVLQRLAALNRRVCQDPNLGDGFCIGHSYFCHVAEGGEADVAWYERIVRTEIGPLLREYWFDQRATAEEEIGKLTLSD